jgi:branched-chain amino acid transport system permease protein
MWEFLVSSQEYFINVAIVICLYSILGLSLNLVVGYCGLLSLAHSAFYGLGAYATAICLTRHGIGFFTSLLIGVFVSAVASTLIGIVLSRFRHDFYALCSLGFSIIVFGFLLNMESLTNGALGLPGITRPEIFGIDFTSNHNFLALMALVVALVALGLRYLMRSPYGRVVKGLREDEEAIEVFGFKTQNFKLIAFVIGAMIASIAGSFFASYISFIDPFSFTMRESILVATMIIVGGLASLPGSILGAMILVLLPEALRFVGMPAEVAAQVRQIIYGLGLVLLMIYRPRGIMGQFRM